ncbi:hypothetical protein B0H19DRAFT_1203037 [Mycena capillaripes]|nr:hypothetical protein B0H19DRAFT_1203037 [Mycena capillaripes]
MARTSGNPLAYRHLHFLQGCIIPRLHGTVRLPISEGSPFLHPIVDLVHGLAIEYIASPTMADVAVGADVTSQGAKEISRRILDGVAAIRDAHCLHNDLRLTNVVFRNWPRDPQPVVIDFGTSSIMVPGTSSPREEASFGTVKEGDHGDWHVGSPLLQHVYERHAQVVGYATINSEIEQIPDDVRAVQFERIPGSGGPDEKDKRLQWRVRPGIRTQDDYVHEWLLTYPPDPDEDIPPPM